MTNTTYVRLLAHAAKVLGSAGQVRIALEATPQQFAFWTHGDAPLPTRYFLRLVDLLDEAQRHLGAQPPVQNETPEPSTVTRLRSVHRPVDLSEQTRAERLRGDARRLRDRQTDLRATHDILLVETKEVVDAAHNLRGTSRKAER